MADSRTYIRVHDGMDDHPKVVGLSDGAFRLLMRSWAYCSRQLTDGQIPDAAWKDRGTPKARRELVSAGLAHLPGDGCTHNDCPNPPRGYVQMHDYLEHQRSAAEVAELRKQRAAAGSKGGRSRANGQANAKQVLEQTPSKTQASTETETETYKNSSRGGSHVSSGPVTQPPLLRGRCADHQYDVIAPKCGACKDARIYAEAQEAAKAEALPDYRLRVVPPLCGQCDDRWIDGANGIEHCPRCHPAKVSNVVPVPAPCKYHPGHKSGACQPCDQARAEHHKEMNAS